MGINRKAKNLQNLGFEWIFILLEVLRLYIILHITIGRLLSESKGPTLKLEILLWNTLKYPKIRKKSLKLSHSKKRTDPGSEL